jgi:hypothetical protein
MHRNAHTARSKNAAVENANKGGLECMKMCNKSQNAAHTECTKNAFKCIVMRKNAFECVE